MHLLQYEPKILCINTPLEHIKMYLYVITAIFIDLLIHLVMLCGSEGLKVLKLLVSLEKEIRIYQ